jgi:large subunit ribosomal protein L18
MISIKDKREARLKRKKRVRKKIKGIPERPRLTVFKTARHIYAQIIDDSTGKTLAAASTMSKDVKSKTKGISGNIKGAILKFHRTPQWSNIWGLLHKAPWNLQIVC